MNKHLKQIEVELSLSKKRINKLVTDDLLGSDSLELWSRIVNMNELIQAYLEKEYSYESKNTRISNLLHFMTEHKYTIADISMDILVCTAKSIGAQPMQGVCSAIAKRMGLEDCIDSIKTVAEIVSVASEEGLYSIIAARNSDTGSLMIESEVELNKTTLEYIEDACYLPPLLVEPLKVEHNAVFSRNGESSSVILGSRNHHKMNLGLDAINIANSNKYCIDTKMLNFTEIPTKPLNTPEKEKAFEDLHVLTERTIEFLLENDNEFFFEHKFDKRGRMYCQGYQINPMGNEYRKSLINLKKEVVLTGE